MLYGSFPLASAYLCDSFGGPFISMESSNMVAKLLVLEPPPPRSLFAKLETRAHFDGNLLVGVIDFCIGKIKTWMLVWRFSFHTGLLVGGGEHHWWGVHAI